VVGFNQLTKEGITFTGNVCYSFLYVIVGVHAIHVLGGVVALLFMLINAYRVRSRNYSSVGIEVMNTYWHFVDLLWIYLLIFLIMIK
jgi:cytochrome c oxidase subunit 3